MRVRIATGMQDHPLIGPIFELVLSKGEPVYLVGGALRDLGLGRKPRDLDFATRRPFEMATLFAERYGSRVVCLGKEATSTYRIPLEGFYLDWVGFYGGSIDTDLPRRDFTVNAMAYDPESKEILDPMGGLKDLDERIIRMTTSSSFEDDPVRIVKAFRMVAQFPSFQLDPTTALMIEDQRESLLEVAPDRLHVELERLLEVESPAAAVRMMAETGVLPVLIPELRALEGLNQNDYHHADVLGHSLEALAVLDGAPAWLPSLGVPPPNPHQMMVLRLAALLHDAGKAETRTVDEQGVVHFYGHPRPSAEMARAVLKRLRFSNAVVEEVAELCLHHLRPLALIKTSPRHMALRRLIHSMGDLLPSLLILAYADKSAAKGKDCEKNLRELAELSREAMALSETDGKRLRRLPKLVDGLRAMEVLGLQRPGPELGHALDALMERQVDGLVTEPDQAVTFLREWASKHLPNRAFEERSKA
jgi:putative nucleotidyltransferase with HDIG domain